VFPDLLLALNSLIEGLVVCPPRRRRALSGAPRAEQPDAQRRQADAEDADELPRIFDRFWRGQAAAQTSGSGIGLAIAAELASAHGGTLTADSQPGAGTRLTLTLPGVRPLPPSQARLAQA